ncbi:T9SS type A sorting domain-containing protein [Flavobacterium ginsenosidimutans]|uniref:T9SS type A sorting domain-containing protein n=1 Tax=Flavobacterium ginsenosidimutans TaxID=687844 RepID=A0ABZ2QBF6_9FLAO
MKAKLLLLLFLANFSIYSQTNLVSNPGFETWNAGVPENWTIANTVTSSYTSAEGAISAMLSYTTQSPKITTEVALKGGVTYTIKFKYKYLTNNFDGTHPISLNISKNGSGTALSSSTFATNNSWTVKEASFTPDVDLSYDLSISTFSFDAASFDVLIDDVQVYIAGTEQYTTIPDIEFENFLIAEGIDSGAPDGRVLTSNVKNIKSLSVNTRQVSDLTGIEDFEALQVLRCNGVSYSSSNGGDGKLKNLDVSKNLNLTELSCYANQLTSLDVSKNVKLTYLTIDGNKISEIDLTNNLLLEQISISNNPISSFDATKHLKLTALDCSDTNIKSIDVTKNIALTSLSVSGLGLTSLDLSKNTELYDFSCYSNALTTLDISQNLKLYRLMCWSNLLTTLDTSKNTKLDFISCFSNQLTALDVSANTALTSLVCNVNKLKSLDVSKNTLLFSLECASNQLTSLNLKNGNNTALLTNRITFKGNPDLTCITVDDVNYANTNWASNKESYAFFSNYDCATVVKIADAAFEDKLIDLGIDTDGKNGTVLKTSVSAITTLDVSNSSITDLSGIEGFTSLTNLNASNNLLKKVDLSKNAQIATLNTSNNPSLICIKVANVESANTWATTKDATTSFGLDCNFYTLIPDEKFEDKLISLGIDRDGKNGKVNTESIIDVETLDLAETGISDLTGIQDFKNLKTLKCNGSPYTGNGPLAKVDLSKNTKLTEVNLNYNQLETLDVSQNTSLTSLNIGSNKLTTIDLSKNTALIYFTAFSNDLTSVDVSKNTLLQSLNIQGNELTSLDVSQNTKLIYLSADSNKLSTIDLSKNTELLTLSFYGNSLTTIDVSNSTKLNSLDVSYNKLTTLNITKNTELASLYFYNNSITTIDFSKNSKLVSITGFANSLTSIDLSLNPLLTDLSVYSNQLTKLDLSKNTRLKNFSSYSNKLESLNLKNGNNTIINNIAVGSNPDLKCILVDDTAYSNANWVNKDKEAYFSNIDCSLVTYIADSKFEDKLIDLGIDTDGKNGVVLTSSIKDLTSLDVSNASIVNLKGIEGFTSLTNLNVSGNILEKLDVSKNSALTTINSSGNPTLKCIQVADVTATENWTVTKDAITSFNLDCNVYTIIPDSKFEDKLIALNIDKDGKNGKVKTESIAELKSLSLYRSGISDLTGIEDFTSLQQLDVSGNSLTKIDVSKNILLTYLDVGSNNLTEISLAKNAELKTLYIGNNKITSVDFKGNLKLEALSIENNKLNTLDLSTNEKVYYLNAYGNYLTSLDLSKNLELSSISISQNQIRKLDFSKNTKLSFVYVGGNKLISLNLKNGANTLLKGSSANFLDNPDLACIQVDDVDYANTNWTERKDVTASFSVDACPVIVPYTLIPDVKFEEKLIALGIDKDGKNGKVETLNIVDLNSLNISGSQITDLTGIQDFTSLKTLDCSNNALTTVDFSKNSLLENLNISKNQLTALDAAQAPSLTSLDCSNNAITKLTITKIYYGNDTLLTNLNCSNNAITSLNLSNSIYLTHLDCSHNELTVLDVSKSIALTNLSTSFNKIKYFDVSKNTNLKEFDCASNNLYNLNVKNGNNANMQNMIFGNFADNPNLLCIQVDDVAFSTEKWIAKDATASYSVDACAENLQYTLIPDPNFEKVLISNGIDKDGENGKVLTSSIENLTTLYALDLTNQITDLTGIEDFASLEELYCYHGALTKLDVSKNLKLRHLDMADNKVSTLDLSKNKALETLDCSSNSLTELNVSSNTLLKLLNANNNGLTSIDISKNTSLKTLGLYTNKLTEIDFSANKDLESISISSNQLSTIDISNNLSLYTISISNNAAIKSLDVSQHPNLLYLYAKNCQITAIDVSKNPLLRYLEISGNKIQTIDVSKNPALTNLLVDSNQLTSLDLRNGKNTLLSTPYLSFTSNPKLYCILVDDVDYANQNWLYKKDNIATYNTECTGEIVVPANNFAVETKSESCLGENNGEISIVAKNAFEYVATINDKSYTFTNNTLQVTSLTPGVYSIKITIPNMIFEQNFNVTIAKGATITGKSNVSSKKVDVEITEGTAPFTVFIDGTAQFQTTDTNFSVDVNKAGLIEVTTAKACEGVFAKKVTSAELGTMLLAYPNPTYGVIEIEIPGAKTETAIELYNFGGQLVSKGTYNTESGIAVLNLENLPAGIYAAKIYSETPEYIKIIKK